MEEEAARQEVSPQTNGATRKEVSSSPKSENQSKMHIVTTEILGCSKYNSAGQQAPYVGWLSRVTLDVAR